MASDLDLNQQITAPGATWIDHRLVESDLMPLSNLGLAFFLPQIIKGLGLSDLHTGLVTSIPYIFGTLGILVWGYFSDRFNERRWSLFAALALAGTGLAGAAYVGRSEAAVAFISLAAIGIYGTKAPFWALPSTFLTGSAAAGGIALINSIGNLGGFLGPTIVGWVREKSGSFDMGLYVLAAISIAASFAALIVVRPRADASHSANNRAMLEAKVQNGGAASS